MWTQDKANAFCVNTTSIPPAIGKQINTGLLWAAQANPLRNFKYYWIYFPGGLWSKLCNQRGQFYWKSKTTHKKTPNIRSWMFSGKLVIFEMSYLSYFHWLPAFYWNVDTQTQISFRSISFWTDGVWAPAMGPADTLVYFSHTHFKSEVFSLSEELCLFLARRTQR